MADTQELAYLLIWVMVDLCYYLIMLCIISTLFSVSMQIVFPQKQKHLSPYVVPVMYPGARIMWTYWPSWKVTLNEPLFLPVTELGFMITIISRLASTLYLLPQNWTETVGGWWLIYSAQIGHLSIHPQQVSPNIGLNGFK